MTKLTLALVIAATALPACGLSTSDKSSAEQNLRARGVGSVVSYSLGGPDQQNALLLKRPSLINSINEYDASTQTLSKVGFGSFAAQALNDSVVAKDSVVDFSSDATKPDELLEGRIVEFEWLLEEAEYKYVLESTSEFSTGQEKQLAFHTGLMIQPERRTLEKVDLGAKELFQYEGGVFTRYALAQPDASTKDQSVYRSSFANGWIGELLVGSVYLSGFDCELPSRSIAERTECVPTSTWQAVERPILFVDELSLELGQLNMSGVVRGNDYEYRVSLNSESVRSVESLAVD